MKRMMIIAVVVIGTLLMTPFVAKAPIGPVAIPRCPQLGEIKLVAVTGKVVYLYPPGVVSADKMAFKFNVSGAHTACNCNGFLYQGNTEDVRASYAALLTAVNNSKLVITFCCRSQGVITPPIEPEQWCPISGLSTQPE